MNDKFDDHLDRVDVELSYVKNKIIGLETNVLNMTESLTEIKDLIRDENLKPTVWIPVVTVGISVILFLGSVFGIIINNLEQDMHRLQTIVDDRAVIAHALPPVVDNNSAWLKALSERIRELEIGSARDSAAGEVHRQNNGKD